MKLTPPLDEMIVTWPFGATSDDPRLAGIVHRGVDLRAVTGTPFVAAADAQLAQGNQYDMGFGLYARLGLGHVTLDGWDGSQITGNVVVYYAHLSETIPPQSVRCAQYVGRTGCSGFCLGDHLHWEVRVDGVPVDPMLYVEGMMTNLEDQLLQGRRAGIDVRWELEANIVRALKRANALEAEAQQIRETVWRRLQDMVNTKDGMAYLPEITLGGDKPDGWEG